ncbi:hypothetical protein CRYUN_Cryun15aG0138200 [Craigia yunnanensis]
MLCCGFPVLHSMTAQLMASLNLKQHSFYVSASLSSHLSIAGFEIKKGWLVNIDATCIHYDPNLYKDPMQFNPSRFDETPKPYSFIPFGSGPRTCLGMNMAKVTMLVFLHRLTTGYE